MNFYSENIRAGDERKISNSGSFPNGGIRPQYAGAGKGDRAFREAHAMDFHPVNVKNRPVVQDVAEGKILESSRVIDDESPAKISGDIFVLRIRTHTNNCGLIAIAVSKFGRPAQPARIIKIETLPGSGSHVSAGIEVFPDSSGWKQERLRGGRGSNKGK